MANNLDKLQSAGLAGTDVDPGLAREINERLTPEDIEDLIRIRKKLTTEVVDSPDLVFLR